MKFFDGMHDIGSRDKTRDWALSQVKTDHFDVAEQPCPAYQNPWELAQMIAIWSARKPASYLELGPYHGGTLYWFIKNAAPYCRLAGVDFFDELLGLRWKTPEDWQGWADAASVELKMFEGNTHDPSTIAGVHAYFEDGLDWLFIDANHAYDHCRQELDDYGSLLKPGSILGLHDVRPRNMGSYRLWEELRHAGYVSQLIVADPYSNEVDAGIGLIYL